MERSWTRTIPEPLNTPEIRLAMEVLRKMSHNTIEREIYEGRLKAARDQRGFASEIGQLTSEVGQLTSEVGLWRGKHDEARERDEAARERDVAKQLVVRQIQTSQRLLHRAVTDASSLLARPLDELRETADRLERELMKDQGTT
jgi:hypothetical protein